GARPWRLTRPYVALKPTIPQRDAGLRIEPAVSSPNAPIQSPADTAAPAPVLEPPVMRLRSHGLRGCGGSLGMLLMASLPSRMAPPSRSLFTAVASPTCFAALA